MDKLQVFENSEFGKVRTYMESNGEITFCGADSARALGYADTAKAVKQHCKEKGWAFHPVLTPGGMQKIRFISEGNLYRLIAGSHLHGAEKFESWIFDEVIPSIRKHGAYLTPEKVEEVLLNPDTIIKLATQLKREQEEKRRLQEQKELDKPKVLFADSVTTSPSSILVREMAKILKQNGISIGERRLYQKLREKGYLIKKRGSDYNMPTQRAMELKLFEIKETVITHSDGRITVNRTPKVTGKGQMYFVNKFLAEEAAV
jgi:phage antirepressor YoqD-like protein